MIDPNDIDGLVGAMQVHLEEGSVGYAGLFSPVQLDYHGIVTDFGDRLAALCCEDPVRYWPVKQAFEQAVDAKTPPADVFALATTRYGREQERGY